jgi:hypothetical protein
MTHKKNDGLLDNFYVIGKRAKNIVGRGHWWVLFVCDLLVCYDFKIN